MATRRKPITAGRGRPTGKPRRDGRRYVPRRRVCAFCADKSKTIDFREPAKLRRYVSDAGKIESRRRSAACAKHQRRLSTEIKRARHLALLPYVIGHVRQTGGMVVRREPSGYRASAPPFRRVAPSVTPTAEQVTAKQATAEQATAEQVTDEQASIEPGPLETQLRKSANLESWATEPQEEA